MQGLWYGDRRDRVKWGALIHLSNTKGIRCIVQVAYFRHGTELKLQTEEREVPLPIQVWDHFSNLKHIERLGKATGLKIIVLDQYFEPIKRRDYINMIVSHIEEINKEIKGRKIIFLDPDTGIEPAKSSGPEHVTKQDMEDIWEKAISQGDILIVYQHADRTKRWLLDRKNTMSSTCENTPVEIILGKDIASDVAMLWCCKGHMPKSDPKTEKTDHEPSKTSNRLRTPHLCACSCGEKPNKGYYFLSGHDAKLKSIFLKVSRGEKRKLELDENRLKMYEMWKKDKSNRLIDIAREVLG
jgi:hypothetical protein